MSDDYRSIGVGATERFFTVVNRTDGLAITSGTISYYLVAKSGTNDGLYWRDSDQTWQVAKTANLMTHQDDGHWEIDLTSSPFEFGVRYVEWVEDSLDRHVPDSRHLIGGQSSGSFALLVNVTVQDTDTNPVDGANVSVNQSDGTPRGIWGSTNTDGLVQFRLSADTHQFVVQSKSGFATHSGTTVAITTNGQAVTVTLTRIATTPPSQQADGQIFIPRIRQERRPKRLTFADAVDNLLLTDDVRGGEQKSLDRAIAAVEDSIDQIATYNDGGWKVYHSHEQLLGGGVVSLPEVTVSTDSGHVKLITITGTPVPTKPSWMRFAHMKVNREWYPVVDPMDSSSTEFKVEAINLANGTIAAQGSSWEQLVIPLDNSFRRRGEVTDGEHRYPIFDADAGRVQGWRDFYNWARNSASVVKYAGITTDERFQGTYFLSVWPVFGQDTVLSMFYERHATPLQHHRVTQTGVTVSTVGSSTTVTSSASIFDSDHAGAMLVVAADNADTIRTAGAAKSLGVASRVITQVNSATEIYVDSAVDLSDQARAFYITDIVDVQSGPMCQAFLRLCEWNFSRGMMSDHTPRRRAEFIRSVELALSDDDRYRGPSPTGGEEFIGSLIGDVNARPS